MGWRGGSRGQRRQWRRPQEWRGGQSSGRRRRRAKRRRRGAGRARPRPRLCGPGPRPTPRGPSAHSPSLRASGPAPLRPLPQSPRASSSRPRPAQGFHLSSAPSRAAASSTRPTGPLLVLTVSDPRPLSRRACPPTLGTAYPATRGRCRPSSCGSCPTWAEGSSRDGDSGRTCCDPLGLSNAPPSSPPFHWPNRSRSGSEQRRSPHRRRR